MRSTGNCRGAARSPSVSAPHRCSSRERDPRRVRGQQRDRHAETRRDDRTDRRYRADDRSRIGREFCRERHATRSLNNERRNDERHHCGKFERGSRRDAPGRLRRDDWLGNRRGDDRSRLRQCGYERSNTGDRGNRICLQDARQYPSRRDDRSVRRISARRTTKHSSSASTMA